MKQIGVSCLKNSCEILERLGYPEELIAHTLTVSRVALSIADRVKIKVDKDLILKGALYHDIGRCRTHGIEHAVVGAKIARELGLSNSIIKIIERHIGAGITAEEAEDLGLPRKDYIPHTPEEKIVSYADNLINGSKEVSFEEALERFRNVLGRNHPSIRRFKEMHKEIQSWISSKGRS